MMKLLGFICLIMVPASLQSESCSEAGIFATGRGRGFIICSKNDDGKLTVKRGSCAQGTVFSAEKKMCQPLKIIKNSRNDAAGCYNRGYTCADCKTLNYCWDQGTGYQIVATKTCQDDEFCSAYSNNCTKTVIGQCKDDYAYTCNYMGMFPDPYKCDTYYFCENAGSTPVSMVCPTANYYDPLYMECVPYVRNQTAPCPPMQQCTQDNTMRALSRNPNIYYLCIQTAPLEFITRVFRCPRGQIFNGENCVARVITSGRTSRPIFKWI